MTDIAAPGRDLLERAEGALWGQACGDAFGMPNSFLRRPSWRTHMDAGPANSPYHAGYQPGTITDDTEQAQALSVAFAASPGALDTSAVARELESWFDRVGGVDSLAVGPSTKRALVAIKQGVPVAEAGTMGTTNGAPMRVSAVGVWAALNSYSFDELLDDVAASCLPTHNTSIAISGAAAVATAVWAGVRGLPWEDSLALAITAAAEGEYYGNWIYGPSVGMRIGHAVDLIAGVVTEARAATLISEVVGMGEATAETVPAAFAAAAFARCDPEIAIRVAGNARGDTDTVAAIAGAIAGAHQGAEKLPAAWRDLVAARNSLDVAAWARALVRVDIP